MTREEAATVLKDSKQQNEIMRDNPSTFWAPSQMADGIKNAEKRITALNLAISALRAPTREKELESENAELKERIVNWRKYMAPTVEEVKKVWNGCYMCDEYKYFMFSAWENPESSERPDCMGTSMFCPNCGKPLTKEAVGMMLERWKEALE